MAERERWYFTKEELEDSPSRRCGITADKELLYRQQAANLIQDMGQKLKVNQLVINTAIVYMHRFYTLHSFSQFHRNAISSCALFLAAKVEEQHRKLEHVIKMSQLCLCRENCDTKSEQFQQLAAELVHHENLMLRTLGFDLNVQHPHTWVVNCLELVRAKKDLAQTSYIMATNSLHLTTMCLQYKPAAVACICIYFVCKWAGFELARSFEGKDWWTYVDPTVTQEMLEKTTAEFLDVLKKCPARLKKITNTNSSSRQMNNSHKIPMDRFSDNSKLSLKYNHSRSSRSMIEQQKKESEQHESSRNNKNIDDYRYHHRRENLNAMPKELAHFPTMNSSMTQSSSSSGLLMKENNALSTKSQPHSNISSRNNNNNNNTNSSALIDEKPLKTTMADNNNSYDSISNSDDKTKTNQSVINNSNNNTNNNNNNINNNRLSCNMNNNLNDSLFTQDSQMFSDSENSDYSAVKKEIPDLEMEFTDNEESDHNIGLNSTFIMNDSSDPKLIPNSFAEFNQQFNHNKNNTTSSTNNDVKCPQTSSSTLPLYNEFTSNNLTNFVKNDPETLGEKSNMMANKKPTIVGNRNIDGDFNKHGQQTSSIHLDPLKSIPSIPNSHYDPGAFSLKDSKPPLSALPQQTMQQQPSHPPQPQIISSGLLQSAPGCILGGDVKNFPAVQSSAAFNQLINDTYHSSSSNNLLNSHEETSNHSRSSRHKHHKEKHKHKDKHKHKEKHKHKHKSKDKDKHTTSFSLVSPENQPSQNQSLKLTIRKNDLLTDNAAGIDEHGDGNISGGIGLGVKTKSINNSEVKLPKKSSSTTKESISATSKSSRKSTHKTKKAPSQSPPPPLPPTTTATLPLKLKINLKNQNVLSLELSKNKKRKT